MIGARLNWLLSHGKGRQWGPPGSKKFIHVDIEPREMDSNVEIAAPLVGDIGSCVAALLRGMGDDWKQPPAEWTKAISGQEGNQHRPHGDAVGQELDPDGLPLRAARAARRDQGAAGRDPGERGRQHARPGARRDRHVSAAQAPRRRHLGRDGHRHGLRHRRGGRDRQAGARRSRATARSASPAWRSRRSAATTCRSASSSSTTTASIAATASTPAAAPIRPRPRSSKAPATTG